MNPPPYTIHKKQKKSTPNKYKPLQISINKSHNKKQSNTTPEDDLRNGRKCLAYLGYFLHQLEPDIRRLVRRRERLHSKIKKKKQSVVYNQMGLYIYIYIYILGDFEEEDMDRRMRIITCDHKKII